MKKINWKDIGIRCLKTFLQGFLASLCVTSINGIDALKSALIGAVAGGISALTNLIIKYLD